MLMKPAACSHAATAIYAWFRALNPAGMPYPGGIPSLVWSTIGRLIAVEAGEDPQRLVRIRVRAADGSWAAIQAARLDGPDRRNRGQRPRSRNR